MRRLWAAGAAVLVCLVLGGLPTLGEGNVPGEETATCGEDLVTLTLTVSDLIGMEGLELTAVVGEMGGLPPELFDLVIDGSPFEATDSGCFEAGKRWMSIAIGEPPCDWPIGPQCADFGYRQHCDLLFEALPGEDVWVWVEGNPGRDAGCPVLYLGHSPGP